jgi:hypothetical protein
MTVSKSDLIEFFRAVEEAIFTSYGSSARWKQVARQDKGPDSVERLKSYEALEGMQKYLSVDGNRVGLKPPGYDAVRDGHLEHEVARELAFSNTTDPDILNAENPFSRSWLASDADFPVESAVVSGRGPFHPENLSIYLRSQFGVNVHQIEEAPPAPDILVLGRQEFSKSAITSVLTSQKETPLGVYSHAMLLGRILTGLDPNRYPESLSTFTEGHSGIDHVLTLIESGRVKTKQGLIINGDAVGEEVGRRSEKDSQPTTSHADLKSENADTRDNPFSKSWLNGRAKIPVVKAIVKGGGPFERNIIWTYLNEQGVKVDEIDDHGKDPDLLVLGQTGYSNSVSSFLSRQEGTSLRICSQEMLLSWMYSGRDPNDHRECLSQFIEGHPALECVREALDGKWPGTDVMPTVSAQAKAHDLFVGAASESPLKHVGYTTGKRGNEESDRRHHLETAFYLPLGEFPGEYTQGDLKKWGTAGSGLRLKKMAKLIATRCRAEKEKDNPSWVAIEHWEADLDWLRDRFFSPTTFTFDWPPART